MAKQRSGLKITEIDCRSGWSLVDVDAFEKKFEADISTIVFSVPFEITFLQLFYFLMNYEPYIPNVELFT